MPALLSVSFLLSPAAVQVPDCAPGLPNEKTALCREARPFPPEDVLTLLAGGADTARLEDGVLTLAARTDALEARLCCSVQEPLTPRAPGLFADRFRLYRGDEAVLSFWSDGTGHSVLRGERARPAPETVDPSKIAGVARRGTLRSEALNETRRYRVYIPPGVEPAASYPVLVLADGDSMNPRLIERMITDGTVRPFVAISVPSGPDAVIGVDGSGSADDYPYDVRAADYLFGYFEEPEPAARFAQHLTFVADELIPHVLDEIGLTNTDGIIVSGYSNGGAFAASAAAQRPDVFTAAIPLSEAGKSLAAQGVPPAPDASPVFLFSAGLYERAFRQKSQASAAALAEAGYTARHCDYPAGHDFEMWTRALADSLSILLAPNGMPTPLPPCPMADDPTP